MYTSVALVALSGLLVGAQPKSDPSWQKDYPAASKQGKSEKKPVAVFIGSGSHGYDKVADGGKLTREMKEVLAKKYVCVYVDTSEDAGQELADKFQLQSGLVLSDRIGTLQAFRHEGTLPEEDLGRYLEKYADPEIVVTTTETHTQVRTSYYPSEAPPVQVAPAPLTNGWSGGGFSSGCST